MIEASDILLESEMEQLIVDHLIKNISVPGITIERGSSDSSELADSIPDAGLIRISFYNGSYEDTPAMRMMENRRQGRILYDYNQTYMVTIGYQSNNIPDDKIYRLKNKVIENLSGYRYGNYTPLRARPVEKPVYDGSVWWMRLYFSTSCKLSFLPEDA